MSIRIVRRRDRKGAITIVGTIRPAGSKESYRIRQRAGTDDEDLAREEAVQLEREIIRRYLHGERPAVWTFNDAAESYIAHAPRTNRTIKIAMRVTRYFNDTPIDRINQEALDKARKVLLRPDAAPATVRRNLIVPVAAILQHAARRGKCAPPLFDAPVGDAHRPAFLMPHQVEALTAAASPHLRPLIGWLACTGCRLSEALGMEWRDIDLRGARAVLWEGETKSGRRRVIELVPGAVAALEAVGHRTGRVFLSPRKEPYATSDESGGQIKTAWATAWRRAGLPGVTVTRVRRDRKSPVAALRPESGPHVLRHSFATWHYALHHDPMRLRDEGGWSTVALVERYARVMPAGHEDAIRRVWGLGGVALRIAAK